MARKFVLKNETDETGAFTVAVEFFRDNAFSITEEDLITSNTTIH